MQWNWIEVELKVHSRSSAVVGVYEGSGKSNDDDGITLSGIDFKEVLLI